MTTLDIGADGNTSSGHKFRIVSKSGGLYRVEFLDYTPYCPLLKYNRSQIERNSLRDRSAPSFRGVGILGCVEQDPEVYKKWADMISRVLEPTQDTYRSVAIDPEFLNLEDFANWYNKEKLVVGFEYELDKDLFSEGDIKTYSTGSCCLLPREINSFLNKGGNRTIYFDGSVYFPIFFLESYHPKEEVSFETLDECVTFCENVLNLHLKVLVRKYEEYLQPYVRLRLMDYGFRIKPKIVERFPANKVHIPVADKRDRQQNLARQFATMRLRSGT